MSVELVENSEFPPSYLHPIIQQITFIGFVLIRFRGMVQGCVSAHIIHNLPNLNSISISTSEETVTKQWDLHILVITLNSENNK